MIIHYPLARIGRARSFFLAVRVNISSAFLLIITIRRASRAESLQHADSSAAAGTASRPKLAFRDFRFL